MVEANAGYAIFDVTADKGIRAWGPNLAEAFRQAALGLWSLMVDPATVRPRREVSLTAEAGDREALLVAWLNELLYLYEAHGFVAADCAMRVDTEYALSAVVRGEDVNPDRHVPIGHVKAATYHLLRVAPGTRGWEVQAVVDV